MGCSSCQENNHAVSTTHVHTSPVQTPCGCNEPVCLTPQPCTEITDSQCIVYTGPDIVCGNQTIIPNGTSIEKTLELLVQFICSLQPQA